MPQLLHTLRVIISLGRLKILLKISKKEDQKRGLSSKKSKKKKNGSSNSSSNGTSNKTKSKSKAARSGTQSGSNDEDEVKIHEPLYKDGGRDQVMVKLEDTIQPMNVIFIVAFLNWKGTKEEDIVVLKRITGYREKAKKEKDESGKNPTVDDVLSSALADEASSSSSNNRKCNTNRSMNPNTDRGACNLKLDTIMVEGEKQSQSSSSGFTKAQWKERQKNIKLHIQLIDHASRCKSSSCKSSNCAKMKSYLKHGQMCKFHANQYKGSDCPILLCIAIRECIHQLTKQEQAVDDCRWQEVNRHHHHGMKESQ
eukprot:10760682-Ditylum_brightwellii.AAC.1